MKVLSLGSSVGLSFHSLTLSPKVRLTMPPVRGAFAKKVGRKVKKAHLKKEQSASESARLDTFTRGMIWGMHLAKVPREEIQRQVFKKDGSCPKIRAIDYVIAHKVAQPAWKGEDNVWKMHTYRSLQRLHDKLHGKLHDKPIILTKRVNNLNL